MQLVTVELVMKRLNNQALSASQKGAALILIVLILVLAASAIMLSIFDTSLIKARQDSEASISLAEAKAALIGYSFGRVGGGERPGNMPYPDYFASTETPVTGDYDGTTDGCMDVSKPQGLPLILNGANMRCLGRLPWKTIGMAIANPTQNDALGAMPWYAVSANLVDSTCLNLLNPNVLNMSYTGYICGGATLPHPWLTVHDSRGNVLSNRVAIVLMLPSKPIGVQARPVLPLGDITNYLDSVVVPAGCSVPCVPGPYTNAGLNNDFIMASGLTGANSDQNNQNLASSINDKVLYITIDELMVELTKRAAGEARNMLNVYKSRYVSFPYAAPLGSVVNNFNSSGFNVSGMLPVDSNNCTCTSSSSCTCPYSLVSVTHSRPSGATYTSASGCTRSARTCTCTGIGQCKVGLTNFTCAAGGNCTFSGAAGTFTYTSLTLPSNITSAWKGCTLVSGKAVCTSAGNFSAGGLDVPSWFRDNIWQEYFYYRWNALANLQVGTRTGVGALVIGAGAPITSTPFAISKGSAQARPSTLINDYLDSAENTNGDLIFDATTEVRTRSYNDQTFVVYP